jgi:anti-sigma regulatory factor (Ser/Thr protein kinase)
MNGEKQLARLTVAADEALVTPVRDFVNRVLAHGGVPEDQLMRLDLLVEEACLHVVQNNFEAGEGGEYDVLVLRRPNQLVIALEDRGLPRDVAEAERREEAQLGLVLMRAFADEVIFRNLGKGGKRIEVVKNLVSAPTPAPEPPALSDAAPPVAVDRTTLRLMTAGDAMDLARCIYRAYGYTYGADFVYFPDKVAELLAAGRLASCVAVNETGEVVGHLGLQFAGAGARVADSGVAVVDPRYRGRKLFENMKTWMADWAKAAGVLGLASEAVAVHPITQKGNINLGAGETGVLPGYLPAGLEFRNIKGGAEARRQTAVMYYLKTGDGPVRDVHAPPQHREMLGRIYDNVRLARRFLEPAASAAQALAGGRSVIDLRLKPDVGRAFLKILSYGEDALALVHNHLRELRLRKLDCIFLDLPLADPHTARLCGKFEDIGFSFAGVGVETAEAGDSLRLLHLNNVDIDRAGLVVVSPHGQALAQYVLAALDEAGRLRSI